MREDGVDPVRGGRLRILRDEAGAVQADSAENEDGVALKKRVSNPEGATVRLPHQQTDPRTGWHYQSGRLQPWWVHF